MASGRSAESGVLAHLEGFQSNDSTSEDGYGSSSSL
jgi:hypothetical protein